MRSNAVFIRIRLIDGRPWLEIFRPKGKHRQILGLFSLTTYLARY